MCVECEQTAVQLACFGKGACFAHKPLEEGYHGAVASEYHALRMPLHAYHRLMFGAFHRLDESVGREGRHGEPGCRLLHGLMVEGVDGQRLCSENLLQQA